MNSYRIRAGHPGFAHLRTASSTWLFAVFAGALSPAPALAQTPAQSSVTVAPAVVVTASPIAGDPDRFATIVTQITRDDILQSGGDQLSEALKTVPGLASTGFAAGASRPVIRGMDAFRVATLENGLSSSDVAEVGPDHGVPIDPLSAQDIEVVRGAATMRYGSQAIGGVVNAINNRVPRNLSGAPLSGDVSASYDDNGAVGGGSALVDGHVGQFAFHADAFGRRASDYTTPDGDQANSFFRGRGGSIGSSYFWGPDNASRAGLAVIQYDAKYGIPSDTTFIDMSQTKVTGASSIHVSEDGLLQKLNLDVGYANYSHDEIDPADHAVLSTFKNREWNGRAEALLGSIGPLSASAVGVQYGKRNFSGGGEAGNYLSPTETNTFAGFVFTEADLWKGARLQAAGRVEHVSVDGTPISGVATSVDFTPVSGSVGVSFDVAEGTKLGVTLTSAGRAPGQVELFARGPHDGPQTFETGDPALKIERANSLEGTLRYRKDRFKFEGAVWGAKFDNYIYGDVTGALCTEDGDCTVAAGGDLKQLVYRQRDATFYGAEAHATYDLISRETSLLQAVALADVVRARLSAGGGDVPRIQPYRVGAGLNWSGDAVNAGFLAFYVGKQDNVPAGDSITKSYVNLDAQIGWRPFAQARGFEVSLVGHNLTDDVQRNAVSLNRDVVEEPGRNIRVVLRQSF